MWGGGGGGGGRCDFFFFFFFFRTLVVYVLVLLTLLVLLVGQLVCWTESSMALFQFQGELFSVHIFFFYIFSNWFWEILFCA